VCCWLWGLEEGGWGGGGGGGGWVGGWGVLRGGFFPVVLIFLFFYTILPPLKNWYPSPFPGGRRRICRKVQACRFESGRVILLSLPQESSASLLIPRQEETNKKERPTARCAPSRIEAEAALPLAAKAADGEKEEVGFAEKTGRVRHEKKKKGGSGLERGAYRISKCFTIYKERRIPVKTNPTFSGGGEIKRKDEDLMTEGRDLLTGGKRTSHQRKKKKS